MSVDREKAGTPSTLAVLVRALDTILAELGTLQRAVDSANGLDAADRHEMKRRLATLSHDAESFLQWVCDQRDFGPHN